MAGIIKVNPIPGTDSLHDKQIFEYTDTLSLPIDAATYGNSHIGDVVKVGDIYGVLVTEIAPADGSVKPGDRIYDTPTHGNNGPGFASVRVSGGAFWMTVEHAGEVKAGSTVYVKNAVAGGKSTITTDKTAATAIGFLARTIKASESGPVRVPVVMNH